MSTQGKFTSTEDFYTCKISSVNIINEDIEYTIQQNLKANEVTAVLFMDCNLNFIPNIIFETFPNVKLVVNNYGQGLKSLKQHHFKGANNLKYFRSFKNGLTKIESDVFRFAPKLKTILLLEGSIVEIEAHAFRGLTQLTHLYLNDNELTNVDAEVFTELETLEVLQLAGNGDMKNYEIYDGNFEVVMSDLQKTTAVSNYSSSLRDYYVDTEDYVDYYDEETTTQKTVENTTENTLESEEYTDTFYPEESNEISFVSSGEHETEVEIVAGTSPMTTVDTSTSNLLEQEIVVLKTKVEEIETNLTAINDLINTKLSQISQQNLNDDFKVEMKANKAEIKRMVENMLKIQSSNYRIGFNILNSTLKDVLEKLSENSDESNKSEEWEQMQKTIEELSGQIADIQEQNANSQAYKDAIKILIGAFILIVIFTIITIAIIRTNQKKSKDRAARIP